MQRTPPTKVNHVPTYLKTAPSTTPQEAMDARQQAHINELTEQLRTAEYMSKKLREELAQAQAQMKAERASLQDQRLKEAQAWKVGTELMRTSYQVTQARLLLLLDMERRNLLSGEDVVRRERLAKVQRDYNLALFQQKENELEERILELQEMVEVEREERAKGDQEYEELREKYAGVVGKYGNMKGKFSTLLAKSAGLHRDLEQSGTKRNQIEDDISRLEEEVTNLKAESATLKSSLKRESLRFDGIKNEKDELENANAELKRSNADLKRQVDKWQNLENKEGTETEKLRKERIALEVKLREVETRLSEREQHFTEELEFRGAKVEKFRARLQDYVNADKDSRELIAELEQECEALKKTVVALREKNMKLKAELSTAEQEIKIRDTVERGHRSKPLTIPDMDVPVEDEEPAQSPPLKPKSTRKREPKVDVGEGPSRPPPSKKKAPPPEPESESEEVQEAPKPKPRPKPVKKPPSKDTDGVIEDNPKRGRRKKTTEEDVEKPRPKPKPKKKPLVQEVAEDSDVEVEETEAEPSKPKGKGKAKSTVPQESISNLHKKRARAKTPTDEEEAQPPKKKSATKKATGRPSVTSQRRDEEDEAEEEAKVKKKRKLKIFNSSQPSAFTLTFGSDKGTNGLDIPTQLSPMKEGGPTIPRSIFSSRTSSSFMR